MAKVKTSVNTSIEGLIGKFNELSDDFGDINLLFGGDSNLVDAFNSTLGSEVDLNVNSVIADSGFFGILTGSLIGNVTGDVTGNADTATALATSRDFSITGDVTASIVGFDGTGNVILSTTLSVDAVDSDNILANSISPAKLQDTAVTPAVYGSASSIPIITVDQQGRITLATTAATSSTLSLSGDTGTDDVIVGTDTLAFTGGEGVDTTITNNTVTIAGENATTSNKGIASFATADFAVTSGAVTIKPLGVSEAQINTNAVTKTKIGDDAVGSAELDTVQTLLIKNSAGSTLKTMYTAGA
jgi:hypothetical protein